MNDTNEAVFLIAIADEGEGTATRLVFSDWLEERGDSARAEFLRVQCELAATSAAGPRWQQLRLREGALLDAHRSEWCQAFGLPLEGVAFERGLVARMRLADWAGGALLDPACMARIAPVTELDLSGLQLGDDGLAAFAESARLPGLRKLFLNGNGLTDAGAAVLAAAPGLPRLDTVYLFQNSVSDAGRLALQRSPNFRLTNLDLGVRAEGYCMSAGEADMARR